MSTANPSRVPIASPTPTASFKLRCTGWNLTEVDVDNYGDAPAPVGTVVKWDVAEIVTKVEEGTLQHPKSFDVKFPEHSGIYTFTQLLPPGAKVRLGMPTPAPGPHSSAPPLGVVKRTCKLSVESQVRSRF
jgi:hypothetical protein